MNHLETLVAEFYEYTGHFVRRNVRSGKRARGGYDVEMDVLAYLPDTKELIHIETSGAATTWKRQREIILKKKFDVFKEKYEQELKCKISQVKKVIIIGWAKTGSIVFDGKIEVIPIPAFLKKVAEELGKNKPSRGIVPEHYPLLRSIQLALYYC